MTPVGQLFCVFVRFLKSGKHRVSRMLAGIAKFVEIYIFTLRIAWRPEVRNDVAVKVFDSSVNDKA